MSEKYIELDNARFTTMIVDLTVITSDRKVHCLYCGKILLTMNRKFAIVSDGAMPYGGEVPLNVFRFTRLCSTCSHYYIIYLDGKGKDL